VISQESVSREENWFVEGNAKNWTGAGMRSGKILVRKNIGLHTGELDDGWRDLRGEDASGASEISLRARFMKG